MVCPGGTITSIKGISFQKYMKKGKVSMDMVYTVTHPKTSMIPKNALFRKQKKDSRKVFQPVSFRGYVTFPGSIYSVFMCFSLKFYDISFPSRTFAPWIPKNLSSSFCCSKSLPNSRCELFFSTGATSGGNAPLTTRQVHDVENPMYFTIWKSLDAPTTYIYDFIVKTAISSTKDGSFLLPFISWLKHSETSHLQQ